MYYGRKEFLDAAHEAIQDMLSYGVEKQEVYKYLTNELELTESSYELQCCIFDQDPVEYMRVCSNQKKKM